MKSERYAFEWEILYESFTESLVSLWFFRWIVPLSSNEAKEYFARGGKTLTREDRTRANLNGFPPAGIKVSGESFLVLCPSNSNFLQV